MSKKQIVGKLVSDVADLKGRVKKIEAVMALTDVVSSFDWSDFNELDQKILHLLFKAGRRGTTTTKIAEALELPEPVTQGRVKVYLHLKRIERISRRLKGISIVVSFAKKWSLSWDSFDFDIKEKESK